MQQALRALEMAGREDQAFLAHPFYGPYTLDYIIFVAWKRE
jgi:hypothetical protein